MIKNIRKQLNYIWKKMLKHWKQRTLGQNSKKVSSPVWGPLRWGVIYPHITHGGQSNQGRTNWQNKPEGASVTPVPKRFIDKVIFHLYGPNRSFPMFPIYIIQCTPTCAAYCTLLYNIENNSNPSALHTVHFTSYNKTFKTSFVFWLLAWQQVSFSWLFS